MGISLFPHSLCICIYTQSEEYIRKMKVMQEKAKEDKKEERRGEERQQVEHLFESFGYLKFLYF